MEGLSAAASGIAVVSFAVQLAESFKKLHDFWKSIKEAPEDIRATTTDLEFLSNVLLQIAYETQHVEPDETLIAALNGCCVKVKILTTLLDEIEPGFTSKSLRIRKWTAFRAVLKHGELVKFQENLERLKSTLLLAQQNQYSRLSRNRYSSLERSLVAITQGVSSLSMQQYSETTRRMPSMASNIHSDCTAFRAEEWATMDSYIGSSNPVQSDHSDSGESWGAPRKQARIKRTLRQTDSIVEFFLGTIRATSTTSLQTSRQMGDPKPYHEQDQYESKTSYVIYPAPWLIRLGFQYGLHLGLLSSSTDGWKNTLKTFCPVPDDALIFEFCRQGNVSAVQTLLSEGRASVRDTDSWGLTPLHFAAKNFHPELCKVLEDAGADMSALDHYKQTPVRHAADVNFNVPYAKLSEAIDTFRLFVDSMDFLGEDGDGWNILMGLCADAYFWRQSVNVTAKILLWMLRLSSSEMKANFIEKNCAEMLYSTLYPDPALVEVSDLILRLGGHGIIDTTIGNGDGYTILHQRLVHSLLNGSLSALLARGPNLHRRCFDEFYTPYHETPTSLAMYSSWTFTSWLHGLASIGVDTERFIDQELEQNPEVHDGWEKETLLHLFEYGDRPDLDRAGKDAGKDWICSNCKSTTVVSVQPYWRHFLERIKKRMHPENLIRPSSEFDDEEKADSGSMVGAASSLRDPNPPPDTTGNVPVVDLDMLPSESDSGECSSGYPATISLQSDCIYSRDEIVCMDCWLHYKRTGTRRQPPGTDEDSSKNEYSLRVDDFSFPVDDSSDDEFSPFHIHS